MPSDLDGIMVFDGLCGLCSAQVKVVLRLDRGRTIRFVSIQSPYGKYLASLHGLNPEDPSTFLFFEKNQALESSEAVLAILRRLPAPWRWLRVLRFVPVSWRDAIYRLVARHRYKIFGRRASCMVPSPDVSSRFISDVPEDR